MLEVINEKNKNRTILNNAFHITEKQVLNGVDTLKFSLPSTDPNNKHCEPFNFVKINKGALYQITKVDTDESEIDAIQYSCLHVISILNEKMIDGAYIYGNQTQNTRAVIQALLNFQSDFVLKDCDYQRYFEYGFENVSVAEALFSVANVLDSSYMWITNTSVYPYQISLKKINMDRAPDGYARKGINRLKLVKSADYERIKTKIKPLGYAEGISQVNIASVNGGDMWLTAPKSVTDQYGIKEYIWIDRRYTSPETLLAATKTMLTELSNPYVEYEVDLLGDYQIGDVIEIPNETKNIIIEKTINHDEIPTINYRIANKTKDVADEIANVIEKSHINEVYSQGSTTKFANGHAENADANTGYILPVHIDEDMWRIIHFKLYIRMEKFRAYGATMSSNGGKTLNLKTQTNSTTAKVTQKNINVSTQTQAITAYSSTQTLRTQAESATVGLDSQDVNVDISNEASSLAVWKSGYTASPSPVQTANGHTHPFWPHYHRIKFTLTVPGRYFIFNVPGQNITIPSQPINVTIPSQPINFSIPSETLSIQIPALTGTTVIESHTHSVIPKITRAGNPTNFALYVGNQYVGTYAQSQITLDVTQFLVNGGSIKRDSWVDIKIVPNSEAYIYCAYDLKGFIQPKGKFAY